MELQNLIDILAWVGGITGVLLLLMLLSSIILGSDFDFGIEADVDGQSMGFVKAFLTFTAIASLTMRSLAMHSTWSLLITIIMGIGAGILAVIILFALFKFLLGQQEDGTWKLYDAIGQVGRVYIPIPARGSGRIMIKIGKVEREISASSKNHKEIPSNHDVLVVETDKNQLIVTPYIPNQSK